MRVYKDEEFEKLWYKNRISPTGKMKELKGSKNKTLKINTLLQTPLLRTTEIESSKVEPFEGRVSNMTKDFSRNKPLNESSVLGKSQNKKPKKYQNIYKDIFDDDMKCLQEYKVAIGKYEEAQPSLKWPYIFTEYTKYPQNNSNELKMSK